MAIALVAAAAMLANQGGGGLVQQAYAAVVSLTSATGETLASNHNNGDTVTFTNNAGVPLVISSVSPTLAGCTDGSTLGVGASCSGTAACSCGANQAPVDGVCVCVPGYVMVAGNCIPNLP